MLPLKAIWYWFARLIQRRYKTVTVEELPAEGLKDRAIYLVKEDGFKEQVAMICPCGCGSALHMNLIPDERPCWRITIHDNGSASLHPSVWRKKECASHFWFREGRVHWCK